MRMVSDSYSEKQKGDFLDCYCGEKFPQKQKHPSIIWRNYMLIAIKYGGSAQDSNSGTEFFVDVVLKI